MIITLVANPMNGFLNMNVFVLNFLFSLHKTK